MGWFGEGRECMKKAVTSQKVFGFLVAFFYSQGFFFSFPVWWQIDPENLPCLPVVNHYVVTSNSLVILTRLTVIFFFFLNPWDQKEKKKKNKGGVGGEVGSKMQKFERVGLSATKENFCSWMPYLG